MLYVYFFNKFSFKMTTLVCKKSSSPFAALNLRMPAQISRYPYNIDFPNTVNLCSFNILKFYVFINNFLVECTYYFVASGNSYMLLDCALTYCIVEKIFF